METAIIKKVDIPESLQPKNGLIPDTAERSAMMDWAEDNIEALMAGLAAEHPDFQFTGEVMFEISSRQEAGDVKDDADADADASLGHQVLLSFLRRNGQKKVYYVRYAAVATKERELTDVDGDANRVAEEDRLAARGYRVN